MIPDRPEPLVFDEGGVSPRLRERENWVAWRYSWKSDREEWTKIPVDTTTGDFASSTDPQTWSTFESALQYHNDPENDTDGLGFVLSENDTVVGVDLDDCRDPDTADLEPWARELLDRVPTYTEVSPSGTGLHLIGLGFVPDGGNRADIDDAEGHLEVYDSGRYLTVTGQRVEDTPPGVEQVNSEVESIHSEYIADTSKSADIGTDGGVEAATGGSNPGESTSGSVSLTDEDLLERAKSAKNGDDFTRLWKGNTAGYDSHSEARLAFANHLAYWTGCDSGRMLKLFEKSNLYRGEDDTRTFENYEIPKAISDTSETYTAGRPRPNHPDRSTQSDFFELSPEGVKARASLGEDGSIGDLDDREKAACVWDLIEASDTVHVRVRRDNGSLWAFDNGVWKAEGERALRHAARRALGSMNYGANVLAELKAQAKSDPVAEVEADTFELEPGSLAVKNGLIDLEAASSGAGADARRDLEPEDYALRQLPVEYDPDAEYDEWASYVEEWAEDGRAKALQEYVGYCLHRGGMPIHRALMLVGSGANGKGTFLHVVRELLGTENTSSVELQTLANEKDAVADFYGSLANIDDDLSARDLGAGLGMFKKLVAGDRVRARNLYESGFEYQATGKHLYAANEVPDVSVSDEDEAFWRRWLLVEFPNHYPASERDPHLRERLSTDEALSGVLNWAIEGWARLLEQRHFTNEEQEAYAKRQRWQSWGESADKFLADCVEHDPDAERISTGEAHQRYVAWCRENGQDHIDQGPFTKKLKTQNVGYGRHRIDGSVKRGYTTLGFTDAVPSVESPDTESETKSDTSLDSFEEKTDGGVSDTDTSDTSTTEPSEPTLTERVREVIDENYGPRNRVSVASVAGGMEVDPDRVKDALEELASGDGPITHTDGGYRTVEVSD